MHRVAVLVVGVLLLASCGDSTSSGDSGDVTLAERQSTPLAEFFGGGANFDAAGEQAKFQELEKVAQEAIRACMAEQGFEYIPMDSSQSDIFDEGYVEPDEEWGSREFAEKYGFGIVWQMEQDLVMQRQFEENRQSEEDRFVDPNEASITAMSEAERDAYYSALYGESFSEEPDENLSDEELDAFFEAQNQNSCQGKAYEDIYNGPENSLSSELEQALEGMWERLQNDSRVVTAKAEWASCMAEAGYTVGEPEEFQQQFWNRVEELMGYGEVIYGDDEGEGGVGSADASPSAFPGDGPTEPDLEAIAALGEEEIAAAVASFDCGVELQRAQFDAQVAAEQAIVDEFGDELEEMKANR